MTPTRPPGREDWCALVLRTIMIFWMGELLLEEEERREVIVEWKGFFS